MGIIQGIFSSILEFSSQLGSSASDPHHSYQAMCNTHRRFREAAGLLIKGGQHYCRETPLIRNPEMRIPGPSNQDNGNFLSKANRMTGQRVSLLRFPVVGSIQRSGGSILTCRCV